MLFWCRAVFLGAGLTQSTLSILVTFGIPKIFISPDFLSYCRIVLPADHLKNKKLISSIHCSIQLRKPNK